MFLMHPACLAISFALAFSYTVRLGGKRALRFQLLFMLPMMIVAALINPAFSHQGVTTLCYLPDGNPLTLESILYGIAAAAMLATVITWFSCFNAVMSSDKFIYLFGRVIPALSLLLSMALRFVPLFKDQIRRISDAQRCVGRDVRNGTILRRARHGVRILSIMVTWALENAIETADSMNSRGYGLPGRTAFSIYRFGGRDKKALIFLFCVATPVVLGTLIGKLKFVYYPVIQGVGTDIWTIALFVAWFALCSMPTFVNIWYDIVVK
jgi:energy-coupling factor transport system permease protein